MLYLANEDYELKCYDSLGAEVDLSGITPASITVQKSTTMKINNKYVVTGLIITATLVTGSMITTSIIDGSNNTFVSASATLTGSTENNFIDTLPICLADENATILNLAASKCTKGKLVVTGVNTSTSAPVVDNCDIWFCKAGQTDVRGD